MEKKAADIWNHNSFNSKAEIQNQSYIKFGIVCYSGSDKLVTIKSRISRNSVLLLDPWNF